MEPAETSPRAAGSGPGGGQDPRRDEAMGKAVKPHGHSSGPGAWLAMAQASAQIREKGMGQGRLRDYLEGIHYTGGG